MKRKRNYPPGRMTKSMKHPVVPGIRGFDLKRNMAELEQRSSKGGPPKYMVQSNTVLMKLTDTPVDINPDSINVSPVKISRSSPESWMMKLLKEKFHDQNWFTVDQALLRSSLSSRHLLPFPEIYTDLDGQDALPRVCEPYYEEYSWYGHLFRRLERLLFVETPIVEGCYYTLDDKFKSPLDGLRRKQQVMWDIIPITEANSVVSRLPEILLSHMFFLEREVHRTHANCQSGLLPYKHLNFITFCGKILSDAYKLHENGDSTALELLLEHGVPKRMWEVGWQKFLDHLDNTGQHGKLGIYLQEAYNEIFTLRNEMSLLEEHWLKCLEGLDMYSQKLHQPRRSWARGLHDTDDDPGGGGYGMLEFAKHWHKPLSTIAQTVLKGWSIVGRLVRATVYVEVGYVFCQIDRW